MAFKCTICGCKIGLLSRKIMTLDGLVCYPCIDEIEKKSVGSNLELDVWLLNEKTKSCYANEESLIPAIREALSIQGGLGANEYRDKVRKEQLEEKRTPLLPNANYVIGTWARFDDREKKMCITDGVHLSYDKDKYRLIAYSDILSYELLEDGGSVTSGGLARAVAGNSLFGGKGAVVGAVTGKKKTKPVCTDLRVKIVLANHEVPAHYLVLIGHKTSKDSFSYRSDFKSAQDICAKLEGILRENQTASQGLSVSAVADDLRTLKGLLDDGVISQAEFDAKKSQLLGI